MGGVKIGLWDWVFNLWDLILVVWKKNWILGYLDGICCIIKYILDLLRYINIWYIMYWFYYWCIKIWFYILLWIIGFVYILLCILVLLLYFFSKIRLKSFGNICMFFIICFYVFMWIVEWIYRKEKYLI